MDLFEGRAIKFPEKIITIIWLQMCAQNDFLQFVSVWQQDFI